MANEQPPKFIRVGGRVYERLAEDSEETHPVLRVVQDLEARLGGKWSGKNFRMGPFDKLTELSDAILEVYQTFRRYGFTPSYTRPNPPWIDHYFSLGPNIVVMHQIGYHGASQVVLEIVNADAELIEASVHYGSKFIRVGGHVYERVAVDLGSLDKFTWAYIDTALWSSHDESDEYGGDPMDENYDANDIAPETLKEMTADCKKFQEENEEAIDSAEVSSRSSNDERAGHDFWLTRNGHGAGFWDGDWSEPQAEQLTEASEAFGEYGLYIGDDGMIYGSGG